MTDFRRSAAAARGASSGAASSTISVLRECIPVRDMTDCLIEAYDCVARLAYEKFVARGSRSGGELDDWLNAEHELLDNLAVHIEDQGDSISALVSVPGLHAAQITIGIESKWMVIVGRRESEDDSGDGPDDASVNDAKIDQFSRAVHSHVQTARISAASFALSPEFHARRQAAAANASDAEKREKPPHLFSILELPAEVDPSRAVAVLADGLLGLRVPKKIA
jgi:HSP20 family molecular chaperone IbpA